MRNISKYIPLLLLAMVILASCGKELIDPVADFKVLDKYGEDKVDINNILVGEPIIFENAGIADNLVIWTGDKAHMYSEVQETLALDSTTKTYDGPLGNEIEYIAIKIGDYTNLGAVVNTKTGQFTYTYKSAGLAKDTTYTVTWVATNIDVHGDLLRATKQITVRVKE